MIDYEDLLKKYIEHVVLCEGYSFISNIENYEGFTDEEIQHLQKVESEII